MKQNYGERSLVTKSRRRELIIVLAALLLACLVGWSVRAGLFDPMSSSQPDVVAK